MARCRPLEVTTSTSTVGLPRESYTERAWILVIDILAGEWTDQSIAKQTKRIENHGNEREQRGYRIIIVVGP